MNISDSEEMDPIVPRRYQKEPSSPVTTPQERNDIVSRGALRHADRNLLSRAYHALPQMLGRSTYANIRANTINEATNANLDAGSILSRAVAAAEEADLLEGESLGANESEISWMQARWEGGFLGPTDPVEVF